MTGADLRHVLIVDDSEADVTLTREAAGPDHPRLRLHHAFDAVDALAWLARQGRFRDAPTPDLILLDLNMPKIGGLALLRALRHSAWAGIPVFMFSTSAREQDRRASLEAGAMAYWTKPAAFDDLVRLMAAVGEWASGGRSIADLARHGADR